MPTGGEAENLHLQQIITRGPLSKKQYYEAGNVWFWMLVWFRIEDVVGDRRDRLDGESDFHGCLCL